MSHDPDAARVAPGKSGDAGQKFFINIEDAEHAWESSTITVAQIRTLGQIPPDQQIVAELPDGTEKTLGADEIIELQPGHRFGRAPKYKRGQ